MGVWFGRTKKGNFVPYFRAFLATRGVGKTFRTSDFVKHFLAVRSSHEPDFDRTADKRNTAANDSLRTCVSIGVCERIQKGVYKILRVPTERDAQKFNRDYPSVKSPGRKKGGGKRVEDRAPSAAYRRDDVGGLTKLGSQKTDYKLDSPSSDILETFDNKYPERDYKVQLVFPEWTSLCPRTGQPDFATITVEYIPNKKCVESKSLKLYFFAYRNYGAFMESITNKVLEDLVAVCSPRWMRVTGKFNARGGTFINVEAEYYGKG